MEILTVVLIVLAVLLVAVVGWAIATYNGLVRLRNLVQEAWRQIDVELHRRHALVPNLVETVKGYASQEREVFEEVTRARAAAATGGLGPNEQAQSENALSGALSRLFAVAENYPELRSSENFADLQAELTNTEDRIAAGRRFYNANVRELNTRVETFPPNLIAGMFSFRRAEYFEANDPAVRAVPSVHFAHGEVPAAEPQPDGGPSFGGQRGGYDPRRDA
ncbi:LemA family protein [Georgenia sp. H159]|uniref:LemA family protein n=1 Tax=Georgenia sp. H159 TaxID=3076115 RepID=UPI002D77675A|nr:LemA family protein [Georgenia sp. H159]